MLALATKRHKSRKNDFELFVPFCAFLSLFVAQSQQESIDKMGQAVLSSTRGHKLRNPGF
jgi:hypothetical protein